MCGLAGIISSTLVDKEIEIFEELLAVSALRGTDSAGVALGHGLKGKTGYHYVKMVGTSLDLMLDKTYRKMMSDHQQRFIVLGHTRAATLGSVTRDNAQPVIQQQMIGCHNGTIPGLGTEEKSDSVTFYERLASSTIKDQLERIRHGAYALVWVDLRTSEMHMLRNDRRPLWLMYSKGHGVLLWASEATFLRFVAARSGATYTWEDPFMIAPDVLHTFDLRVPSKRTQFTTKPMVPPPFFQPPQPTPKESLPGKAPGTSASSYVMEVRPGHWRTREQLAPIIRNGCSLCTSQLNLSEDIHWIDGADPVCPTCHITQRGFLDEYVPRPLYHKGKVTFFKTVAGAH